MVQRRRRRRPLIEMSFSKPQTWPRERNIFKRQKVKTKHWYSQLRQLGLAHPRPLFVDFGSFSNKQTMQFLQQMNVNKFRLVSVNGIQNHNQSNTTLHDHGSCLFVWSSCLVFINGPFPASFFFIFVFSIQLTINVWFKYADDWIRTEDLYCWKRPLYQLSQNHCPVAFCLAMTCVHFNG